MKKMTETEVRYRFVYFDYRPSVWLVIVNGVLVAVLFLISFIVLSVLVQPVSYGLILGVLFLLMLVSSVFLSRFKYRKRGILEINENGVTIETAPGNSEQITWSELKGVNVRFVDHFMIRSFDRLGGFFRYHQIGDSDRSINVIDRIGFNGREFFLYIRRRSEFMALAAAIGLLKQRTQVSYDNETYNFKDSVR